MEFKTHGIYNTGDYIIAHNDAIIKNNLKSRVLDYLYLRPTPNSKKAHDFYHISTNKIISRSKCTPLPMIMNIIHLIVAQAKKDNMPEGLKFSTNTNTTVYPPDWIAGVDYEIEHEEYNSNEECNNHNINEDNQIDTVDTNKLHEILHQVDDDNLSDIFQNTEEEIIFEPDEDEMQSLAEKENCQKEQKLIMKEMKMS